MMRVPRSCNLAVLALGCLAGTPSFQAAAQDGDLPPSGFGMWILGIFAVAAVALYWAGVRWLRRRAIGNQPEAASGNDRFSPDELERYARHIVLREIGGAGQQKIKNARVIVIGAGGLGSASLYYLAAAGVGTIGIVDDDVVEVSNLQRQIVHTVDRLGRPKADSATEALSRLNPHPRIVPINRRLEPETVDLLQGYDLVLDGSDSFGTRRLANGFCVQNGIPYVFGAISQWEGQVSVFSRGEWPCLACIFPEDPAPGVSLSCAEGGVLGALPGIIGSMMAAEAIKIITGAGHPLASKMLIFDALWGESRTIRLQKNRDCAVCGTCPEGRKERSERAG